MKKGCFFGFTGHWSQLTWVGNPEPVCLVEQLDVCVRPRPVLLGEGPGRSEDSAEWPDQEDGDQDREQLEQLKEERNFPVFSQQSNQNPTCILESRTFPSWIVGSFTSTFLRYCEQIVMTMIVLRIIFDYTMIYFSGFWTHKIAIPQFFSALM